MSALSTSTASGAKTGRVLLIVGRSVLGLIFVVAAYAKMRPQASTSWSVGSVKTSLLLFAMQVDSYQMLPTWAVNFVAHVLPPFELVLGLWLLSGFALRVSSLISSAAILGFIVAMVSAYERGLTISCGCFGPGEQIGPMTLVRDGLIFLPLSLAVTIGAFILHRRGKQRAPMSAAIPEGAK